MRLRSKLSNCPPAQSDSINWITIVRIGFVKAFSSGVHLSPSNLPLRKIRSHSVHLNQYSQKRFLQSYMSSMMNSLSTNTTKIMFFLTLTKSLLESCLKELSINVNFGCILILIQQYVAVDKHFFNSSLHAVCFMYN